MLAYWKLLLLNRLAALKPGGRLREGQKRWKAFAAYAAYALLVLALYGAAVFLEMLVYHEAKAMGEPEAAVVLALLGCTLVTLIYGFFYVISLLFFGKDNAFVGALPIPSWAVLTAKLSTVLLGEAGIALLVGAPLLVRYGIEMGMPAGFYVRALCGLLFLPMAPVAVAALLACLLIRVSALWKRREGVTTVMTFVLLGLIIAAEMSLSMNMDEEDLGALIVSMMLGQGGLTETLVSAYPPLRWLTRAITGSGLAAWGNALLFMAFSAGSIALIVALFGRGYMRLALRQEETLSRVNNGARRAGRSQRTRSPFWALYRQEMREVITVPTYATNCLTGVVVFPVMIVIMALGLQNNGGGGPLMQMLQAFLPPTLYLAVAAALLSLTAIMGMAVSTAVSREGRRHEFRRIFPVSGRAQLGAKLLMGMTYNAVSALMSAIALWILLPAWWLQTLIALVISQLFSLFWCMVSLMLDVYHPKLNWKTETEAIKQSMNAMLSMLIGFGMIAVMAAAAWLMIRLRLPMEAALAADVALLAVGNGLMALIMKKHASVTYYLREYSN